MINDARGNNQAVSVEESSYFPEAIWEVVKENLKISVDVFIDQ